MIPDRMRKDQVFHRSQLVALCGIDQDGILDSSTLSKAVHKDLRPRPEVLFKSKQD